MSEAHGTEARPFDAESVIHRLEEAGATLLALPGTGWSTRLRSSSLEIVRTAVESYGWTSKTHPSANSFGCDGSRAWTRRWAGFR